MAELVGLDPATVPATAADIEAYYARMRPMLRAGDDAQATARFLTVPTLPWGLGWTPVRPLWIGVAAYGFSLLPRWARRMYGLPGLPTTDLTATLTSRTIRSRDPGPAHAGARGAALPGRHGPGRRAVRSRPTRNAGASARISRTRTAGTAKATRRSTSSPTTPMTRRRRRPRPRS